ncbi:hypothetical protein [Rhodococcus koreensis]
MPNIHIANYSQRDAFGPVEVVPRSIGDREVIALANDAPFGFAASA